MVLMKRFTKFPLRTIYVGLNALSVGSFLVLLYFTQSLLIQFKESNQIHRGFGSLSDALVELSRNPDKDTRLAASREAVAHVPEGLPAFEQKKLIQYLEKIQTEVMHGVGPAKISESVFDLTQEVTGLRTKYLARFQTRIESLSSLLMRVSYLIIFLIVMLSFYGTKVAKADEMIKEQQAHMANSARMSAIGEMAGGISHEINNPLGFILGYTEQIESAVKKDPVDREKILKKAEIIKSTCERIAKIIKGLKSMARDGSKDQMAPVEIKKILGEVTALCENTLKRSHVQFEIVGEFENLMVECREVQIGQVLLNLVNNARDAIEKIDEKWIRLTVSEETDFVRFAVADCGSGIPKEIQDKILQPFFTTKPAGDGTGLGLSISVAIAETHKGRLYLDTKSKNTTFVLEIPKEQKGRTQKIAA